MGITIDFGGNLWVCREALDSKYSNEYIFHLPSPSSLWSALRIYFHGIAKHECNRSSMMVVRLKTIDEAKYTEVHNLDKEDPEMGASSPEGTSLLRYQV